MHMHYSKSQGRRGNLSFETKLSSYMNGEKCVYLAEYVDIILLIKSVGVDTMGFVGPQSEHL